MTSLQRALDLDGELSLNQFVQYLKEYAPGASMSYPTALKLIAAGKLQTIRRGNEHRIERPEVLRWIAEGNWVGEVKR